MPEPGARETNSPGHELRQVLDQELSRLPEKYRVAIVLCDLQGRSGKEAAQQLGWPEGTVASRLFRGRALLAKRLIRRGLACSAAALAALSGNEASAGVPTSLVGTTIKAARSLAAGKAVAGGLISAPVAALTEGVLKAMFVNKIKTTLLLLAAIGLVGTGVGGAFRAAAGTEKQPPAAGRQHTNRADVKQEQKSEKVAPVPTVQELRGKWAGEQDGIKVELTFEGKGAHWQVEFQKDRKPENPGQLPTTGVNLGADLKCAADTKGGHLNLYLPAYLGDKKELKRIPALMGRAPVGQVERVAEGAIRLRIIPTGYEDAARRDYDYPAVRSLTVRRVDESTK